MLRTASVVIFLTAAMCTLGETSSGDSASKCVEAQKISTSACQTAPDLFMCEANQAICNSASVLSNLPWHQRFEFGWRFQFSGAQGFTSYEVTAKRAASPCKSPTSGFAICWSPTNYFMLPCFVRASRKCVPGNLALPSSLEHASFNSMHMAEPKKKKKEGTQKKGALMLAPASLMSLAKEH